MKNRNLLSLLTLAIITFFSSCQTIENINIEMTEEEAVEFVEQSLAYSAGGYAKFAEALATVYAITNDSCSITGDTTLATTITTGVTTYNYASEYDYTLNCTGGLPSSMTVDLAANGTLTAPRVGTTGAASVTNGTLGNLGSGTEYSINCIYTRSGTGTSKIAQKGTYTYNLTCTMANITMNKTTKTITGGTATYTFAGVSQGFGTKSFNYTGSITFSSTGTTMTLAGNNHTIVIN